MPPGTPSRYAPLLALAAAALASCSPSHPQDQGTVIVASGARGAPAAAAAPAAKAIAALPLPAFTPAPRRTRAFRDPPLPAELAGDHALAPLPPRPPASAFGQGEQH